MKWTRTERHTSSGEGDTQLNTLKYFSFHLLPKHLIFNYQQIESILKGKGRAEHTATYFDVIEFLFVLGGDFELLGFRGRPEACVPPVFFRYNISVYDGHDHGVIIEDEMGELTCDLRIIMTSQGEVSNWKSMKLKHAHVHP